MMKLPTKNAKKMLLARALCTAGCVVLCAGLLAGCGVKTTKATVQKTTRTLLEGTPMQTELVFLKSEVSGPTLFVVGGVHGDEIAGYEAANRLKEEANLSAGTLVILSPANADGAARNERGVTTAGDLNRSFPGSAQGDDAARLAYAIYSEIEAASPIFVLDMHEAYARREGRDYLGSSLIFTAMDGMEDLVFQILEETKSGALCAEPFNFYSGAPAGSINQVVTQTLHIPVMTVETLRDYPLERRVGDHLAIAHKALRFYGMEAA